MTENCFCKKTPRPEADSQDMITRLNRIEGQVRGIKGMVQDDQYCINILTQVIAVSAALKSFSSQLLTNHIKSCVVDDIKAGNSDRIDELINTINKFMR